MTKPLKTTGYVLCLFLILASDLWAADITLGVNAHFGAARARAQYGELAEYLARETGKTVELRPLALSAVIPAAAAERNPLDFILANPVQTLIMHEQLGVEPVATVVKKAGPQFAGVIVAKAGSGIAHAADLKGKRVMSMKHRVAAGGYMFQAYHLLQQGIDVDKDFSEFLAGSNQETLVKIVAAGRVDAAFVRSGILEGMADKKLIKLSDFVVVDQREDPEISLLHTTQLYPEWSFSSTHNASAANIALVKNALMKLSADDTAAKTAKITGFTEPVSLEPLKTAMTALKIAPFDS